MPADSPATDIPAAPPRQEALIATGGLVLVAAVWGATFVTVKQAILEIPPFEFLAIRFVIATLVLVAIFPKAAARATGSALLPGILIGSALGIGYMFQTLGLQLTSATNAGFITGLFVVFTPLAGALVFRRLPSITGWLGVLMATAGLGLLTLRSGLRINQGDALVAITAIAFALHIVLLGRFAPHHDYRELAILQLAVSAIGFTAASLATERFIAPTTGSIWFAILLTSLGASSVAFLVMTWAQARLSPVRTAVTLTLEPVFAGITGFLVLGERVGVRGLLGAALILAAMLLVARQPLTTSETYPS
jgi:drug/metabolite transporter (DMT)-like permease